LLEQPLPGLCADRVDYFFRDAYATYKTPEWVGPLLKDLRVVDHKIVLRNKESAEHFALEYLRLDEERWSHPREVALFQILADALSLSLQEKIITEKDLFLTDEVVMDKLRKASHPEIQKKLSMLNPQFTIALDPHHYDFHLRTKLRYTDPLFISKAGKSDALDKALVRISYVSPEIRKRIALHTKRNTKGFFIRVLSW
ncbi:hypothetical protein COY95_02635, partial [Candidatus Woesearchaeota archaeon CG_4_10_14_0_8_um_filter_47_5]